jgi:hypothetical protein
MTGAPKSRFRPLFRRQDTGSRLQMIVDEKEVLDKELEDTGGKFQEIESEKTTVSDNPRIRIIQNTGNNPVSLTFRGLALVGTQQASSEEEPAVPAEEPAGSAPAGEPAGTAPAGEPAGTAPAGEPAGTAPVGEPAGTGQGGEPAGTGQGGEPTGPAEGPSASAGNTQTGFAPSGQETRIPSGATGAGASGSVSSFVSETGTSPVNPVTPTPTEIAPNEAGHAVAMNLVAVYAMPLLAAFIL